MNAPAPAASREALLTALAQVVGTTHVMVASPGNDLAGYEQDWRRRARGKALCVVRPGSTQEVAHVVSLCARAGVAVVPQGGNTGLVLGGIPDASGTQVVLSLRRLSQVRALDADNLTITVEAGCLLQAVQQTAQQAGLLFPLSMGSEGSCTIGGNLSTNAGGTQVLRYGNARELCLGLEVVTAPGEIWHGLTGLRKDNTGYDLRDLYIGAEGTLGIITAATLRLFPQPAAQLTAWLSVASLEDALRLLALAQRQLGGQLTGFEIMNQLALGLVVKHFPQWQVPLWQEAAWCVLLESSDLVSETHAREPLETLLSKAVEAGIASNAVLAQNQREAQLLWHIREGIPLAQAEEGLNIKHDIAVPISRIPAFVQAANAAVTAAVPGTRFVTFGHLGDGNLHYNVQAPPGQDAQAFLRDCETKVNTIVFDTVRAHGGSISAEHGIGALKPQQLLTHKSPVALALMRSIKQALDPQNLMNPGKVLG